MLNVADRSRARRRRRERDGNWASLPNLAPSVSWASHGLAAARRRGRAAARPATGGLARRRRAVASDTDRRSRRGRAKRRRVDRPGQTTPEDLAEQLFYENEIEIVRRNPTGDWERFNTKPEELRASFPHAVANQASLVS